MGKYEKKLIERKAGTSKRCDSCSASIAAGDQYSSYETVDRFLSSLHKKSFCKDCVAKHGNNVVNMTGKDHETRRMTDFK